LAALLRACAFVTGSIALAYIALSVVWWIDPTVGHRYPVTGVGIPFVTGLLGFIVMIAMLLVLMGGRDFRDLIRYAPRALLVLFGVVIVVALVSVDKANRRGAHWFAAATHSWPHCHWPLSADHGYVHICVSHARWLGVKLETAHLFVALGAFFCAVSCVVLATLSRLPKSA